MSRCFPVLLLLLAHFSMLAPRASGQSASPNLPSRPKIGLALEGGGALGLAHVGVLEWLEEHHIPVDYVAGTSMGGLVGGFYATGKTPQELHEIVAEQNWDLIIGGSARFEDLSYRRKEDYRTYPNKIVFGLKNGLSLPAGLNAGHQISLLIDRVTLAYSKPQSFDDLPIPFRSVATDLVSGKEEVFANGDLAKALRATMSIPGIFSPIEDQGKVYVDGGLVGNLPTDVVKKMGADVVIAVHLETAPVKLEDIQGFFTVLGRSIDVVIRDNEIRGLAGADLVVNVHLKDFTSLDYPKSEAIIGKGIQAAQEKEKVLAPFALSDSGWRAYLDARMAKRKTEAGTPQFVKVEGTNPDAASHLEKFLRPLAGKPVNRQKTEGLLTRLAASGKFDWASYRMTEAGGQTGLLIRVHEKNYAPPSVQLGFEVDGSESGDVNFTQAARLTILDKAGYRSEWRTDVLFGNTYGISSELYRPFTAMSRWFFAPHAHASNTAFRIYTKNDPVSDYRVDRSGIGLDFGYGFNRYAEARAGYEFGYLDAKLRLGALAFPSVRGRTGNLRAGLVVDRTDDPVIPRGGFRMETTFRWFDTSPGATDSFPALDMRVGYFQPITGPASLFVTGEGGSTLGYSSTGVPQYFLGGPSRLSAYGSNELFGNQYYVFRAGYLHDLVTLPTFVGKKVYAVGTFEFGKVYGAANQSGFPSDFAGGVLAQTALGPFFIGGSVGDSGHHKWFFQLGRVF